MSSMTRWLDVEVGTDDVDLNALPSNLCLVDLHNDNEYRLLMGDLGREEDGSKLRIFQGVTQVSDMVLPDLPLAVVSLYTNDNVPRSLPVIAVTFSSCIYIYRNMKLFYKYYLPSVELNASEIEVWKQLLTPANQNPASIKSYTDSLKHFPEKTLSQQSQNFLSMSTDQQLEFLEQSPKLPAMVLPEITCVTSMKLASVDKHAAACLVVGTEDGDVFVLESQMFNQLSQAKLCNMKKTPYQMVATGLYSVDYRITVATREKSVCLLKRGWSEGKILFSTEEHIIAIEVMPVDSSVIAICADNTLTCYSKKGKKQWSLNLEHRPIAISLVAISHLGATLIAVSLASGHVHLYDGKARRDTIFVRDVASVLKFGQLGQEEHVFIIVTGSGHLMLKILKRTADFNAHGVGIESSAPSAGKPWLIPKKSKLFLEQSVRERENAVGMHISFQQEMSRLRIAAAKTLLEAHQKSDNSVGVGALEPIRLAAEVEGLGPVFRVTLQVENTSEKAVVGLSILFHVHTSNYKVSQPYIKVPLLAPNSKLRFPTKVEEVFDSELNPDIFFRSVTGQGGERALVKILLLKEGRRGPVLAATVQMPPTDPMMLPYDKMQDTAGFGVANPTFANET
ncbi:Bardet-Biedl syndrome 1 protein homolog [Cydia strobilella]|uniref:Bardet-Biedl syndrome 1 protein homolog n=1 Tax=Cydia strobilella TaxID=1100964 RepID=UPI0030065A2A